MNNKRQIVKRQFVHFYNLYNKTETFFTQNLSILYTSLRLILKLLRFGSERFVEKRTLFWRKKFYCK